MGPEPTSTPPHRTSSSGERKPPTFFVADLEGTGRLGPDVANDFGVVGYVARGCNVGHDVRRNLPFAAYEWIEMTPAWSRVATFRRACRFAFASFNWPALARALEDNIVPDFPLCNKSFNQSYSGNDL